jgi:hypothetical protein
MSPLIRSSILNLQSKWSLAWNLSNRVREFKNTMIFKNRIRKQLRGNWKDTWITQSKTFHQNRLWHNSYKRVMKDPQFSISNCLNLSYKSKVLSKSLTSGNLLKKLKLSKIAFYKQALIIALIRVIENMCQIVRLNRFWKKGRKMLNRLITKRHRKSYELKLSRRNRSSKELRPNAKKVQLTTPIYWTWWVSSHPLKLKSTVVCLKD